MPQGVWECILTAGRQLPRLRTFVTKGMDRYPYHTQTPAGALLVRCCPGLASLQMKGLVYSAQQLAPLQGLSGLTELHLLDPVSSIPPSLLGRPCALLELQLDEVCKPTGLQSLHLGRACSPGVLLRLTQLQQLALLKYGNTCDAVDKTFQLQQVRLGDGPHGVMLQTV
jgi:hypothetical protein